jgi:hypothetical protein
MVNNQPGPSRVPNLSVLLGVSCIIQVVDIGANPIDGPTPYASLLASGCAEIVGFAAHLLMARDRQIGADLGERYVRLAIGASRSAPPARPAG